MIRHPFSRYSALVVLIGMGSLSPAHATNGYFAHGYGTQSKAMAGAGVALPRDGLAAATNPAGVVELGNRADFGAAWFSPERSYSVSGDASGVQGAFPLLPTRTDSGKTDFFIPHLGYARKLTDNKSFSVSIYGNGGMNTTYPAFENPYCDFDRDGTPDGNGPFCAGKAGVNLEQLFFVPSYAQRHYLDQAVIHWGVAPIFAYQRFSAEGIGTFTQFSEDAERMSNNGTDDAFGYGARVGVSALIGDRFRLGLSYQTPIFMSEFEDYAGLFAGQGDFDIPASLTVGTAFHIRPTHTLLLDVQYIAYSGVDSIGNSIYNLRAPDGSLANAFGSDNGPGFGWENMTIVKLGYEFSTTSLPNWTWRMGYSHGNSPVVSEEATLNIFAPGVIEDHLTFGFTQVLEDNMQWSLAAMYAFENSVSGTNSFERPGQQEVDLSMDQFELEISLGYRF